MRNQRISSYTHQGQKKAKFVSKKDKNAIFLANFNFLHYAYAYCAYRAVRLWNYLSKLEFVFYVKTDVSPLSKCMSKICKQEL